MTPDRFIAAAFMEWADAVGNEEIGYEASRWIEQRAAELARESVGYGESVAWVAEVFPDWTTLQVIATGDAFAFNRETGQVCKIPHPDCPFLQWPSAPPLAGVSEGEKQ